MGSDDAVLADGRIRWLRRLHRQDRDGRWFLPLAAGLLDIGFIDDAIATLREGLARDPSCLPAWVLLGRSCLASGRLDEARRLFERVIARDRENAVALRGLAEIYRRRGERQRAADFYRALLRLVPWDLEAQKGIAQVLGGDGSRPATPQLAARRGGRRRLEAPRLASGAREALARALIPGGGSGTGLPAPPRRSPVPGAVPDDAPAVPTSPRAAPAATPPPTADATSPAATAAATATAVARAAELAAHRAARGAARRPLRDGAPSAASLVPGPSAGARHLRTERRARPGIFEAPPADLDAASPARRRAPGGRRKRPTHGRRAERKPAMGQFMRWVERVQTDGPEALDDPDES
ncbi:MAG: tetratricopeptide repeat protein [Candidatus Eiseniibacteriota bacterium]|jgi:tetratricopeptide (TPR) repeat protein